ncbi:lipid asymmetry maintenance ABC transporter permease subunit MlaE [Algiphilus sp. W345]|uniref:Intermembrane phospholipid transport system permease protein MlaE n=1 Tax=Banduia mediterranea TaxID=3075609 RepID=A0ABU2WHU5_9GAMM|nr:lipid asymmetry maintenance ABC transporter permease subunit MlaE [Algiphilus sp. W345]MCH9829462.1 lipid asymmetry maintenance ABC transporter permease subunit MlaE [Gammaproteobacteria bacterium]MDT0497447.1 lipid asymmetry maintenance ABC transporter permease subunit MlaE [Algiphilus sp. W345]
MSSLLTILGNFSAGAGRAVLFWFGILAAIPGALLRPRVIIRQFYDSAVLSQIIIVVSGSFIGMVLALQGYRTLVNFGAESSLGVFVALVIIRELGPVVTALLYAGRAGSSMAAEVGLMRATEQLSGMEMMAVDPMKRVIAPRYIAGVLAMPLLTAIFTVMAIGIAGGYAVGVVLLGVDDGSYWSQIQSSVDLRDIGDAALKALVFGLVVNWIALYQGYHAAPNSEGVSRATTTTVVYSSLAILGLDFVLTAMLFQK